MELLEVELGALAGLRLLAGLATFFWVLTAAGIVCLCPFYILVVAPRLRAYQAGRAQLERDEWRRRLGLAAD